jgi:Ca-activated chloride channel family protein
VIVDRPLLLLLAPFVGLAFGALAWWAGQRRVRLARRWSPVLGVEARSHGRWSPVWLGLAGLLAAVALAGPRGGSATVRGESDALSVVFAVDISRSMLAEDAAPSRLDRAIRETRRLVQDLAGDRVGLIAFAGRSYILAPVTVDGRAVLLHLDALDPETAGTGGTALSTALEQAAGLLEATSEVSDRVLVTFTDGESHDDRDAAIAAATRLHGLGIRVVFVAEGTTAGGPIPVRGEDGTVVEYQKDEAGEVVTTRRDDDFLRAVTDAAEGTLVPADVPDQAGAVRDLLAAFKRSPTRETRAADLLPLGWIPALAAGLLLLVHAATRRTAALASLLLAAGAPAVAAAQGRGAPAAEAPEAAAGWLRMAARGVARDTAYYNAGTAALAAGRPDVALAALGEAANSLDPALRYRALYNRGVAGILAARADSALADSLMAGAAADLRAALALEPGSERAKWNLELASRRGPPPPPSGGGGGTPPPPQAGDPSSSPPPPSSLSPAQAQQLLNSVEREERRVRERQLRRRPGEPASGGKDW